MLTISKDQLDHFSRARKDNFCERMVAILESDFPREVAAEQREIFARQALADGRDLGFRLEGELEDWLRLNAEFDRSLPERPWARRILSDTALNPRERLHLLKRRAIFAARDAAPMQISWNAA